MHQLKIKELLQNLFSSPKSSEKKRHIVFWYDEEKTYEESIKELVPDSVKIHIVTEKNNFITKKLLEYDDKDNDYLIYAPLKKPENKDNWLLDILLYSREFSPDEISIISGDIGITDNSLKVLIKKYYAFFKNKERYEKLKKTVSTWSEETMETGIISVICKEKYPYFEDSLRKIFIEGIDGENKFIQEMKKYSIDDRLWYYAEKYYGYNGGPDIKNFLKSILLTAFSDQIKGELPVIWKQNILKNKSNSLIFATHWMNDKTQFEEFNKVSEKLSEELKLKEHIKDLDTDIDKYLECDIFPVFDEFIISYIIENLSGRSPEYERFKDIINRRKTKHWYDKVKHIYTALEEAINLFILVKKYRKSFDVPDDLINAYVKEYYKVDQAYRRFYTAYDQREENILKKLQEYVENIYKNEYLKELCQNWSKLVEKDLCHSWIISDINHQKNFYRHNIRQIISKDERSKIFVIISDGLRYEVAEELTVRLNKEEKIKGDATLEFMSGVVPSCTKLGMAALLPYEKIEITRKGEVKIDGEELSGSPQREKILKKAFEASKVVAYSDLKDWGTAELRKELGSVRVVYIYHNTIDALGDKSVIENQVFNAALDAINDITDCVKKLVNYISATNILITADHGFLYTRDPVMECNKVDIKTTGTVDEKKRYLLAEGDVSEQGTITVDMNYISDGNYKVIVPRGPHIFKTQGAGLNYVHGGASLQEIVIPLIKFKYKKEYKKEKVEVKLTNTTRKITNNKYTLNFFQTEKITEDILPVTLKLSLWDMEENKQISDEKVIIADSASENASERELKVILTLKDMQYDKNKDYYLKVEDEGNSDMIPFRINLAFTNLFG